MVNTILAKRINHIVAKGDNPVWPKGSKSRGFSTLLAMGETKIQTFCREGGIDKRNFYKKRDNTDSRREIPTAWLTFIVEHYGVSPRWLLTGRGQMFTK